MIQSFGMRKLIVFPIGPNTGLAGRWRAVILSAATLLITLMMTACSYFNNSTAKWDDEHLRQKMIGVWSGSLQTHTNEVILFKTTIRSDETFSTHNDIYDGADHFIRPMWYGGTMVVSNKAIVCTITESSEKNQPLPRKVKPEPIIHLDDHEMVILNEGGVKVVSHRVAE